MIVLDQDDDVMYVVVWNTLLPIAKAFSHVYV